MQKRRQAGMAMLLSLAMVTASLAPTTQIQAAQKQKKVLSVSVTNVTDRTVVLKKGQTLKLKTKVEAEGKVSKKVTVKSSKPKVVKVSNTRLKALKNGKSKITVKSKANPKKKVSFTVIVGTPVKSVTLNQTTYSGVEGESFTLKAEVAPAKASVKKVAFSSDNEKVATVDKNGEVKLVAEGTAKITAKSTDNSKKSATCTVTVRKQVFGLEEDPKPQPKPEPKTEEPKTEEPKTEEPKTEEPELKDATVLSREGYTEVWKDEFEGTELDRTNWNVELHPKAWVNEEWQEYVDREENIYVKDGKLYLVPIETKEGENKTYTSGRVNTQGNKDFKYGLFEATIKTPAGKGYLPAFWMMPTDETYYGQWPRCGEIDIMEVMGQTPNTTHGTIHYGKSDNIQGQKQGTATIEDGTYLRVKGDKATAYDGLYKTSNGKSFADDFHTYAVEWEPDRISWYVDGIKYYETNDWYSGVVNGPDYTYPAPFDQPFYMILNLAVGGEWVGYPDETTVYGEQSALVVENVRVSQKSAEYYAAKEEAAEKPVSDIPAREPDESGNYIVNGNFATAIDPSRDWDMNITEDCNATVYDVNNNAITIQPSAVGTQAYSVQLKQPGVPLVRGVEYELTFEASAAQARSIIVDVEGPDVNWLRYLQDTTVNLTTEKKPYTLRFTMEAAADKNACVEFNLGNQNSTSAVTISNVSLKKVGGTEISEDDVRGVRADGNYIYNGTFSEGVNRLGYWEIEEKDKEAVSVTNTNNIRKLKVVAPEGTSMTNPLVIKQSKVALMTGNAKYAFSIKVGKENATAEDTFTYTISGNHASYAKTIQVSADSDLEQRDRFEFDGTGSEVFTMLFTTPGIYYVDDIMLCEDKLIKNGSFMSGMAGFEVYTESPASATYVVDEMKEENAFSITINDTGTDAYHVQLIQDSVPLVKDHCYKLTLKAKSDLERNINIKMCRNGNFHNQNWSPYHTPLKAALTSDYQTFTTYFKMADDSDERARFDVEFGKVDGRITQQHTVCIDDIVLEEIDESEMPQEDPIVPKPYGVNLLTNASFENNSTEGWTCYGIENDTQITVSDNTVTFVIDEVGNDESAIALQQDGLTLEAGEYYKLSFKASSSVNRTINAVVQNYATDDWEWYGGNGDTALTGELQTFNCYINPVATSVKGQVRVAFKLGKITKYLEENNWQASFHDTPSSTIVIKDIKFEKIDNTK
ncbi:MAG: carbohydrate binding domain-containing protein [Lachnospiraceae bacterium]|nr:carbohydrate binding domain-containing protein [Lachnospiraceae bacterium]